MAEIVTRYIGSTRPRSPHGTKRELMLRDLENDGGFYFLDRGPLADEVLGEETWLCCQGVSSLGGAWALRCQYVIGQYRADGTPGVRQQCGALATVAPDGEALYWLHTEEEWFCYRCTAQLPTKDAGMRWPCRLCDPCVGEFFRCERCGGSCLERATGLTSHEDRAACQCEEQ